MPSYERVFDHIKYNWINTPHPHTVHYTPVIIIYDIIISLNVYSVINKTAT